MVVMGIHVSQVVGRRSGKTGHSVQFQGEYGLVIYAYIVCDGFVLFIPSPSGGIAQWGLSGLCGQEAVYFRKFQWQAFFRNHAGNAVFVVYGKGFSPVTLSAEDGIA